MAAASSDLSARRVNPPAPRRVAINEVTPIPDDHADHSETSPGESARRLAAAISGAVEGFVEALDQYDLANETKRGLGEAGSLVRAATEETRAQAATPEMQQLGGYARTAGHATADAARTATGAVRGTASDAAGSVRDTATHAKESVVHAKDRVKESAHHAADSVRESVENARYAAHRVKEEVKVRGEAVAETGRRAKVAPGRISTELRAALNAWKKGLVTSIAMMGAMLVFGTITLIVLTIALVVGLNELLGDPAGTFVVALLYLAIAGIAFAVARSSRARAQRETERRVENAKEEARNVVRPVREAFGRGRTGV